MDIIIEKILDIEQKAQSVYDEARLKEKDQEQVLIIASKHIEEDIEKRAKVRIEQIINIEAEKSVSEVNKIKEKTQKKIEHMETMYSKKSKEWEENIFKRIIGS